MEVNEQAPVHGSHEIEVHADPETVWEVIAGIDAWPTWNPAVQSVEIKGPLAEGTTFRWKAGPGTIVSTLRQVERPHVIGWTGRTFGIRASHVYRLEPRDGRTVVRTEESWEGLPTRLMRASLQRQLDEALRSGLERLKEEAERRSAGTATPPEDGGAAFNS